MEQFFSELRADPHVNMSRNLQKYLDLLSSMESVTSANTKNQIIESLLHLAVRYRRVELFNYLLSLDEINVNCLDQEGKSPLQYLTGTDCYNYFAVELIKKGANLHLTDCEGWTFLHFAATCRGDNALMVSQMAIEKGADVNAQTHLGSTPLTIACSCGNYGWICLLLSYEEISPSDIFHEYEGLSTCLHSSLPLNMPSDQKIQWEQIIFNYVFDGDNLTVQLPTVMWAMTFHSSLFAKIMENISVVRYNVSHLEDFERNLICLRAENFKLFVEKFGDIVEEMINTFLPLFWPLELCSNCGDVLNWKRLFDVILESEYISDFVNGTRPYITIGYLLTVFNAHVSLEEITNMVFLMLSYGLIVTSVDLNSIYSQCGYCELFKMLLHMEIKIINDSDYYYDCIFENVEKCALSPLYYDFNINVKSFLENIGSYTKCGCLLDYYNHPKLKELCQENSTNSEIITKVKKMPKVPLLVELSRNAARNYIINRYHIKNSMQFYSVLKWLPISTVYKRIISLETKLY